MRCGWKVLFFLALSVQAWAGAVRLVNDTSYKLRAVVRAADGTYLGEVVVPPQKTMQWNDYWGGVGSYNQSQTPYTVAWFCLDGGDFSVCNNVPTGATITAFGCDGTRSCRPQKKQDSSSFQEGSTEDKLPQSKRQEIEQDAGPPVGELQ